ncbi:MAG: hypothetical protein EXS05_20465 [Planctomycetaceae bacterium]|nr:hypothetical protein [Planctomycetaceae bacterium]
MYWATQPHPIPLTELGWINTAYLASTTLKCDPFLVWGTTVETETRDAFLGEQRQTSRMLVSPAHVLIQAVAKSLLRHPAVNRRVIGRRVYQYDGVNVVMPMLQPGSGEVNSLFLRHADRLSLAQIAETLWNEARRKAQDVADDKRRRQAGFSWKSLRISLSKRLHLLWIMGMSNIGFAMTNRLRAPTIWAWQQELNGANAFVNYMGGPGAPPLVSYKPSTLPMNSYSIYVTLGPAELRPVVVDGDVVPRKQASLFVRFDHRLVNGHQSAAFVSTLRNYLANPATLIDAEPAVLVEAEPIRLAKAA